jgi:hypothetical protein
MKITYSNPQNSIVNFSNSLLKHFGVTPFHETIPAIDAVLANHRQVAVLLFDGMGQALIRKHLPEGAFLRRNFTHTMTSTFPPTTVAATNGLLSGRHPIETGWLGWAQYFKEHDANVDLFSGRHNLTKNPLVSGEDIRRRLDYEDIMTLIGKQNPDLKVDSVWPSFRPDGVERVEDFFIQVDCKLSEVGPKFVYGYWVQPDLDTHEHGVDHPHIKKIIRDINNRLEELAQRHQTTLFLIIADHGLIDIDFVAETSDRRLFEMLERPYSNEPRAANFYVKPKCLRAFPRRFNRLYGDKFILKTRRQVLDENWYGSGTPHPSTAEFIGDFLAIATDRASFDHLHDDTIAHLGMKAHHAGLTESEMLIDVMALNK